MRCSPKLRTVGLLSLFACANLYSQSTTRSDSHTTFHVSGRITQQGRSIPHTWVIFAGASIKSVKSDSAGHYEADLPLGVWNAAVTLAPGSISSTLSRRRLFQVTTPEDVVVDLFVRAGPPCPGVRILTADGRPPTKEEVNEKNESCAGIEFFPVPSNDGLPFEVVVGGPADGDLCKFTGPNDAACKREFGSYNLLTVQADKVVFTPFPDGGVLEATGSVVVSNGHREYRRNSARFLIGGGRSVEAY